MRFIVTKIIYQKRYLILGWFIGVLGFTILMMYFFPVFKNGELSNSLKGLPPSIEKIIGNQAAWTTIGGFISHQLFALRVPMFTIILSIFLFNSFIAGDEKKGLTETQLTLTNGRTRLLINKVIAIVLIVSFVMSAVVLGIVLGDKIIHYHYALNTILIICTNCLLLCLDFGLVAFLAGCLFGRSGIAIGLASVYAFGSYLLSSMVGSVSYLRIPEKLSLFHYYQNNTVFIAKDIIVLSVFALVCLIIGILAFNFRDIKTNS